MPSACCSPTAFPANRCGGGGARLAAPFAVHRISAALVLPRCWQHQEKMAPDGPLQAGRKHQMKRSIRALVSAAALACLAGSPAASQRRPGGRLRQECRSDSGLPAKRLVRERSAGRTPNTGVRVDRRHRVHSRSAIPLCPRRSEPKGVDLAARYPGGRRVVWPTRSGGRTVPECALRCRRFERDRLRGRGGWQARPEVRSQAMSSDPSPSASGCFLGHAAGQREHRAG